MILIKTAKQVQNIRKSCKLTAETLLFIENYVKKGVSTENLDQLIEDFILKNKGIPATKNYNGYPKSSCISVNDVVCHGIPDSYCLKDGDILTIDVAVILNGYFGDAAKTFAIGKISDEATHLLKTCQDCLNIGINQVKPKNFYSNIGYYIGKYAISQNCSVVTDYTGHGVGIAFHEEPQILHFMDRCSVGPTFRRNMIFTIEPMINLGKSDIVKDTDGWTVRTKDGSLSAQYEHSVLVTNNGYEILTIC